MMTASDTQALIRSAQSGDKAAFEALVRGHYQSMYKMAYQSCGNRDLAQDIVQDVCIKLARSIGKFRFQASFGSWLYRIVINTANDYYRRDARWVPLVEEPLGGSGDAEGRLDARRVLGRVAGLPERERTAVLLVFGRGLSHKEAAFAMGCKESTVSGYVHQARKKLAAFVAGGEDG